MPISLKRKLQPHQDSNFIYRFVSHFACNMFRFSATKQLLARMWIFLSIDPLTGEFCKVFTLETTSL